MPSWAEVLAMGKPYPVEGRLFLAKWLRPWLADQLQHQKNLVEVMWVEAL